MVYGKVSKTIHTSVSGPLLKLTVTEYITGRMVTDTKVNGRCASSMVRAQIALQMEMFTRDRMLMANPMVRVNTSGPPVKYTLAISIAVKSTVKASGEAQETFKAVMFMKAITKTIVNTGKASLPGPVVTFIKETTTRMSAKEMARCCGLMEVCTKVNG
jgi:hypothetical protein